MNAQPKLVIVGGIVGAVVGGTVLWSQPFDIQNRWLGITLLFGGIVIAIIGALGAKGGR